MRDDSKTMGDKDAKEKLERVKAIRAANRGVITKKITDVNEILNGGTINDDQRKALEVLDRLLESKLKTVEELDQSVLSLCSVDAIQAEIEDSEKVLERVVECQKRVHEALQRHKGKSNEHENHSGQTQPTLGTNPAKAKLPKLILPKFRGDVTKWSSFWDSFRSAVHENAAISPVEKFNYLNSLLEGPASRAIQGLSLTDANYRSAVEILQERFGRPQQIISAHMDELLKIPNCSGTERSTSLRFVYDQISVHVRGLSSLGVASDQYGGLLIPVIMAKLPNEIRVRVARETKGSVWKIDGILEIIKQEVEAREMSEGVKVQEERSSKQTGFQQPRNPKHSTTSSFLIAKREQMNRTTQTRCVYCNELHYSASCEKVVNPRDRRNILIEAKRCFKCLFPGHQVKDCTNSRNCRNCGGRHHQSVCFSYFGARESPPVHPPRTRNEPGLINDGESGALGSTVTATSSTKAKGSVLLQTATAIATNEDRSKSVPVRILFDNGSQRSYVTNNLKSKLGLKPTSSETLHLNTFGERAYRKQSCEVVTLPLQNKRNEYLEISALNFPVICSPLPKSVDIDDYPHLQGLELADSSESQCGIDILIGSDHYWDIVTGESIRGNFGPTAINSKFGWLLSGPTNIPSSTNDSNVVSNLIISGEPFLNEANDNDEIVSMLKTFWETESAGIVDDSMCERQVPDITVKRNDISFNGRHYETGLPWKEDCAPTSNNYGMCVSRLRSLHHKLKNEPNLLSEYDKIIQQQCCLGKIDWDTDLQGTLLLTWNKLLEELKWLSNVRIPRCYFQSSRVEIELHGFSDASNRAYAAVVYMRSLYQDGRVDVRLVASKSRVAPLKKQSIPRLELLGAVLLARLVDKFNSTGKQLKTINWTDSMTALCWIKNERMWKQYVQHRVQEIRNLTSKDSWRHCPGELNPADIPSRGLSANELSTNSTWWNGAEFLYRPEAEWPVNRLTESEDKVALEEAVKNPPAITYSLVNTSNETQGKKVDQIIDVKRFPDLTSLLRVTALVIKCAKKFKNQVRNEKRTEKEETRITASDIKEAEHLWIRSVQVSSLSKELAFLLSKDRNSNSPTYVTQFGLFLDEDVIKCKGRLNNAPLPVNTRNPILLPAKHEFTHLLIKQSHECVKHSGISDTLTALRERYWVPRGREAVKKIIRSCVICRKHEGTPFSSLPPTDLPSNRVSEDPPFTHIGMDFAGPLYVETKNSEGETKESQKVYVCLFTCASTRAVHLELTRSLSVESFLLAFRRFTSRRGLPATITSDNAKTFRSSSRDIRNIARAEEVWRFLANKQITWTFIIERAPWWGGFWERLVRSIKKPLKKIVGRSTLSFDELRTILVEIEGVVNSRPLTYVYDDEESLSYPLTPSDLIYGRRITSTPNAAYYEVISTNQSLTKKSRHHRHVIRQLTNQWRREYLIELRERSQVKSKGSNNRPIAIGDLVLLKNDSTSRAFWKLGKVEELIPGRDGNVRAAVVKVGSDSGHVSHLRRVVRQLVPIEQGLEGVVWIPNHGLIFRKFPNHVACSRHFPNHVFWENVF